MAWRLDDYDATFAGRAIGELVDDLSNWYVRRSRRRFWDGDATALRTLRETLVTVAQLLAPFTPFIADEIYDNLDGSEPSVHLEDFPVAGDRDEALELDMGVARETVRLGLSARSQSKLKARQPLRAAGQRAVVGDQDQGQAAFPPELLQQRDDLVPGVLVQVPGRLVGQQHLRRLDQGAGDRDPLLLAA